MFFSQHFAPLLVLGLTATKATQATSTTIHRLIRQDTNSTTCLFTITFDIVNAEVAQLDFHYALEQAFEAEFTNQTVNISLGTVTPNNDEIESYNTTAIISVEEETPEELDTFAEGLVGQTLGGVNVPPLEQVEYTIHAVSCNDLD